LVIPQVDYEPAIYRTEGDPYPHLDLAKVDPRAVVDRAHRALVLENEYIQLTVLPAMGRVYSLVYKPTGHEEFWRNDIVTVGGGMNPTGWWIWIGGAEYTLPGDEHGTTWATPWSWEVVADTPARKAVRLEVEEAGTGLRETLEIAVEPGRAWYQADVTIVNPTDRPVEFAHWINPQWTPGGHNELTDSTEFIIPTDRILIEERWQPNLGPSPQAWAGNPLRFISGWRAMGDIMADSLRAGFYSAYSHQDEEGIVRVFDPAQTPGVDLWTYGYRTTQIPMGSGAPCKGYAEMWGGTSRLYPHQRQPLGPGERVQWQEWIYPYQGTGGLTYADRTLAVNFRVLNAERKVVVGICPSGRWQGTMELWSASSISEAAASSWQRTWSVNLDPAQSLRGQFRLDNTVADPCRQLSLRLQEAGADSALVLQPECDTDLR
jgi:hypothetical protein